MILKNNHLKKLYTRYHLNQQSILKTECPSPSNIMQAIRFPAKKTRPVMDHIIDCKYCYFTFLFLKDIVEGENELIKGLGNKFAKNKVSLLDRLKQFLNFIPTAKVIRYSLALLTGSTLIFCAIHYFLRPRPLVIRSPHPPFSLALRLQAEQSEKPAYFLEWNQEPRAKYYDLHIFDSALRVIWKAVVYDNRCSLPSSINEAIKIGQGCLISLEAMAEDGTLLQLWMGDISSVKIIDSKKETQNNRR